MDSGRYGLDFCFYIQIEGQLAAYDRTGREICVALSARPFAVCKRPDERELRIPFYAAQGRDGQKAG